MKLNVQRGCLALIVLLAMGIQGCEGIKKSLGYPTDAEIQAVNDELDDADRRAKESESALTDLQREIAVAEETEAKARQSAEAVRGVYVRTAQQLNELEGPAFDAMVETLGSLHSQLGKAKDVEERSQAALDAARAGLLRMQNELASAESDIDQLELTLDDMSVRADRAILDFVGFVEGAGESVQALGVPGAAPVAKNVAALSGGLMSLLLGATTIERSVAARRRKRGESAALRDREMLAKAIQVTEKKGLIYNSDDLRKGSPEFKELADEIDKAKAEAREMLGEEALALLKVVRSMPSSLKLPPPGVVAGSAA